MKTTLVVGNRLLQVLTTKQIKYEIIEPIGTATLVSIEHDTVGDIFYLGLQLGIETLYQANLDANLHSLPLVSEDKGHTQGDTTTENKSTQGNQ